MGKHQCSWKLNVVLKKILQLEKTEIVQKKKQKFFYRLGVYEKDKEIVLVLYRIKLIGERICKWIYNYWSQFKTIYSVSVSRDRTKSAEEKQNLPELYVLQSS